MYIYIYIYTHTCPAARAPGGKICHALKKYDVTRYNVIVVYVCVCIYIYISISIIVVYDCPAARVQGGQPDNQANSSRSVILLYYTIT